MKKTIRIEKVEFALWDDDRGYRCFYRYIPSSMGDYQWNVTDRKTGKGTGGFAKTVEEAKEKIEAAVNALVVGKKLHGRKGK